MEEVEELGEHEEENEPETDFTHIDKLAEIENPKLQDLGQRMRKTTQQDGLYDDALGTALPTVQQEVRQKVNQSADNLGIRFEEKAALRKKQ